MTNAVINFRVHTYQQGLALPMTLILLLVMTLLGVTALRITTMEESMVGDARLREIAFNAAETTLRFAENKLVSENLNLRTKVFTNSNTPSVDPEPGDSCVGGYCIASNHHTSSTPANGERWIDPTLDVWSNTGAHLVYGGYTASGLANEGVYVTPKYIVEYLGNYYDRDPASPTPEDTSKCWDSSLNAIPAVHKPWPHCPDDPQVVRITALALAGSEERNAQVMLQSTIVFQN